jgi:hypothetical protein
VIYRVAVAGIVAAGGAAAYALGGGPVVAAIVRQILREMT